MEHLRENRVNQTPNKSKQEFIKSQYPKEGSTKDGFDLE